MVQGQSDATLGKPVHTYTSALKPRPVLECFNERLNQRLNLQNGHLFTQDQYRDGVFSMWTGWEQSQDGLNFSAGVDIIVHIGAGF